MTLAMMVMMICSPLSPKLKPLKHICKSTNAVKSKFTIRGFSGLKIVFVVSTPILSYRINEHKTISRFADNSDEIASLSAKFAMH